MPERLRPIQRRVREIIILSANRSPTAREIALEAQLQLPHVLQILEGLKILRLVEQVGPFIEGETRWSIPTAQHQRNKRSGSTPSRSTPGHRPTRAH